MTNSLYSKCKRCGKEYSSSTCPFCTVTGLDIEALLAEEGLSLRPTEEPEEIPVALVDTVSGKPHPVLAPICKVGRDLGNDIVISGDRSLSRFHFQVRVWGDEYFVEDCGSRNGTFLNGSPISTPRKLHNGDVVSAGMSRYRFAIQLIGQNRSKGGDSDDLDDLMQPGVLSDKPVQEVVTGAQSVVPPSVVAAATASEKAPVPTISPAAAPAPVPDPSLHGATIDPEKMKLIDEKRKLLEMMEKMKKDLEQLEEQITAPPAQAPVKTGLKVDELAGRAREIFRELGWSVDFSATVCEEMSLKRGGKIDAVVRVYTGSKEPASGDVEGLINQQAVVWCQYSYEPKGVLLVQIRTEGAEAGSLPGEFVESMARKKLCVLNVSQLYKIEAALKAGTLDKDSVIQQILGSSGLVPGYSD